MKERKHKEVGLARSQAKVALSGEYSETQVTNYGDLPCHQLFLAEQRQTHF